jgi:hypothetical protein
VVPVQRATLAGAELASCKHDATQSVITAGNCGDADRRRAVSGEVSHAKAYETRSRVVELEEQEGVSVGGTLPQIGPVYTHGYESSSDATGRGLGE